MPQVLAPTRLLEVAPASFHDFLGAIVISGISRTRDHLLAKGAGKSSSLKRMVRIEHAPQGALTVR
jgi:hypothetical protein